MPILQMLSQDHSSEFIEFFLRKAFKKMKAPKEFVTDESKALMKAVVKAFTKCDGIESYVIQWMAALRTGSPIPLFRLQIDRSHFVNNITRKINERDHRRTNFFRGVIGYLIQCEDFGTAKKIIHDFFTVILNKFDGSIDSNPLPSETCKQKLLLLLSSYDESADYHDDSEKLEDTELDVNVDCGWIEEIIKEVVIIENDDNANDYHENVYFSSDQKDFYIKLFSTIVLWSNVTNTLFASSKTVATTQDVESNFKTLKTGIIGRKMIRVDTFLQIHVDYVNAEVKLNAGSKKTDLMHGNRKKRSKSLEEFKPSSQRERSSSIQLEYHGSDQNGSDNGNCTI